MSDSLSINVKLDRGFDEAVEAVTDALQSEGFGVLTRIDVKATLKEKLDMAFRPYVILGACNPQLASRALAARPEVGVLLPCNVTVEAAEGGGSLVRIVDARSMMTASGLADDETVRAVGEEADERLRRVAGTLRGD